MRIGHFFSLRVQMHTYPPAVALRLVSLVPSFSSRNVEQPPAFLEAPPPHRSPLCTGLNFVSVLLSFGTDI